MKEISSVKKPLRDGDVQKFPTIKLKEDKKRLTAGQEISIGSVAKDEFTPPPWLFQHQDLNNALESAEVIDEKSLKNKITSGLSFKTASPSSFGVGF